MRRPLLLLFLAPEPTSQLLLGDFRVHRRRSRTQSVGGNGNPLKKKRRRPIGQMVDDLLDVVVVVFTCCCWESHPFGTLGAGRRWWIAAFSPLRPLYGQPQTVDQVEYRPPSISSSLTWILLSCFSSEKTPSILSWKLKEKHKFLLVE